MRRILATTTLAAAIALAGCYHATVNTGRPLGSQVIENGWAMSFIDGLVPLPVIDVGSQCSNGVARVETYHSILNVLVGGITFGIFTPMTVKVTCAGGGMGLAPNADVIHLASAAGLQLRKRAIEYAANRSLQLKRPVFVDYSK